MAFTLWRGTRLLGELHPLPHLLEDSPPNPKRRSEFAGVLLLAASVGDMRPLMQTTVSMLPDAPTFQMPKEPTYARDLPDGSATRDRPRSHVCLSRLSPEEALGVPAEQRLSIQSTQATVLSTRLIALTEYRIDFQDLQRALPDMPVAAWLRGSLWYVLVGFDSEPPAA